MVIPVYRHFSPSLSFCSLGNSNYRPCGKVMKLAMITISFLMRRTLSFSNWWNNWVPLSRKSWKSSRTTSSSLAIRSTFKPWNYFRDLRGTRSLQSLLCRSWWSCVWRGTCTTNTRNALMWRGILRRIPTSRRISTWSTSRSERWSSWGRSSCRLWGSARRSWVSCKDWPASRWSSSIWWLLPYWVAFTRIRRLWEHERSRSRLWSNNDDFNCAIRYKLTK